MDRKGRKQPRPSTKPAYQIAVTGNRRGMLAGAGSGDLRYRTQPTNKGSTSQNPQQKKTNDFVWQPSLAEKRAHVPYIEGELRRASR